MRIQFNRVVVILGLLIGLPLIAAAEAVKAGWGRRAARTIVVVFGRLCGVTFAARGAHRLDAARPYVFVPNHSSPLDIPALLMARADVQFLAGADLFRFRLLAAAMRALGTLPIDRRNAAVARRQLRELVSAEARPGLVVFPEGGIAPAGERLPFSTGAFVIAVKCGSDVVPVAIHGSADVLPPKGKLAVRPGQVTVEFLPPIPVAGLAIRDRRALRDQTRDVILAALASGRDRPDAVQ